jgi:hypothetical protein
VWCVLHSVYLCSVKLVSFGIVFSFLLIGCKIEGMCTFLPTYHSRAYLNVMVSATHLNLVVYFCLSRKGLVLDLKIYGLVDVYCVYVMKCLKNS